MSDGEDSKKRSKFVEERHDGDERERKRERVVQEERGDRHTKRPRRVDFYDANPNNTITHDANNSDDFSDLLKSYEKQKQLIQTKANKENHRNNNKSHASRNNRNNTRNNNSRNHNNRNKNNDDRQNNRNSNSDDRRKASLLEPRITIREYEKRYGDLSSLPPEDVLGPSIASFLQEKNVGLIQATLAHLGIPETLRYVKQTTEIEEGGGVMTANQTRQRSPGGCFFFLVKEGVGAEKRKAIFTDARGKEFRRSLKKTNGKPDTNDKPRTGKYAKEGDATENESESDNKDNNDEELRNNTTKESNEGTTEAQNDSKETNNDTTETNNGTTETYNGTTETNNGTKEMNDGATETNNATKETNNDAKEINNGTKEVLNEASNETDDQIQRIIAESLQT
eukprot:Phypoly_transcript_10406.p1 GENE.Phypoly_transcript_10406~~Phypoly_transcript_10406.p1  ORF type:complete len:420 (+),score=109.13 Phypoly_transcript_10406:75-1262(+)